MAEAPGWQQQLQHLQTRLEVLAQQRIQNWAQRWEYTLQRQTDAWRSMGHEWRKIDSGDRDPVLTLAPKDPHQLLQDQRQAVDNLQRTREWLAANPIEEVQARRQQYAEAARETLQQSQPFDWPTLAEQRAYEDRFYNEREDRAHFGEEVQHHILVDTSTPHMEEEFQALLARLDQRLGALSKECLEASETQQLQQNKRISY